MSTHRLERVSMTVRALIDILEEIPEEHHHKPVLISPDYGDRTHTEQLLAIKEVAACIPRNSGYSDTGYAYDPDNECDMDSEADDMVIVLRYQI